jgi:hypothetical protein
MAARGLQEAFQACGEDLTVEQSFLKYYVAREAGASLELSERMLLDRRPVKAILTGQRGAGKSVELMRTAMDIRTALLPLYVNLDFPGERAGIPEILMAVGQGMCRRMAEQNLQPSENIVRSIALWARDGLKVPMDEKGGLQGAADGFCKLSERLRRRETHPELAAAIDARREELGQRLSELAADVKSRTAKEVLLVLDGLDRSGGPQAVAFLLESGLLDFQFKCICTLPFPALHSPEFRAIHRSFDMISVQGLSDLSPEAMAAGGPGALDLRDMVEKRTGRGLLEPAALELLLHNCGGNPGDLLRFTGACCLKASMHGREMIDAGVVSNVLGDHRMEMRRFLSPEEWTRLYQVHRARSETVDGALAALLDSGAVLEYPAGRPVYRVHPALLPEMENRPGAV